MRNSSLVNQALIALALLLTLVPVFAQFKVIGYPPSRTGEVGGVPRDKLPRINYALLLPNAGGSRRPIENPAKLQLAATAYFLLN